MSFSVEFGVVWDRPIRDRVELVEVDPSIQSKDGSRSVGWEKSRYRVCLSSWDQQFSPVLGDQSVVSPK